MRKRIIMMIMGVALMALPIMAQQQEWKSTSAMQTSGSAYAPQVNDVGATGVSEMATTTTSSTPNNGPRRMKMDDDWGDNQEGGEPGGSPIGDAVLPLMLCAAVFCGFIAFRRKRSALNG